jgi:hypothetical protein
MRTLRPFLSAIAGVLLFSTITFAQAFGEYGRAVGGIPHGKGITGSKSPGSVSQGKAPGGATEGVAGAPSRALPSRLVVSSKDAGLYPRQDDESQKLDQLNQGEMLTPMVQSAGGSEWFMVKTQKGIIGWVKSMDVREDRIKK